MQSMAAFVHIDPILSKFVILSLIIIVTGLFLRILKQPSIITYIFVGVIVGPGGLKLISDETLISNLGSLGLVLLLFFIGMEIHLPKLIANWRVSGIGTVVQIALTVIFVWITGLIFHWEPKQVVIIGFVLSLSSTAVIVKMLQERDELDTRAGQFALGILIVQDILIVPMLIIINYLGGHKPGYTEIISQVLGGLLLAGIIFYILYKKEIRLPFAAYIRRDHEIQVFVAFAMCYGFAMLSALFGLSSALGAFVAGIIISASRSTKWVFDSLNAFKVLFVALFFVSIGMLIDLRFIYENLLTVAALVTIVFIMNNTINVLVLRIFCKDWRISLYAGSLLSQIGEFSFILGSTGYYSGILDMYTYRLTISTIALSLLLSPFWIALMRRLVKHDTVRELKR